MIEKKIPAPLTSSLPRVNSDGSETTYEASGTSRYFTTGSKKFCQRRRILQNFYVNLQTIVRSQGKMESNPSDESYYFASLFAKCDPNEVGVVKVSVLLQTLRELQSLAANSDSYESSGDGDDESSSLVELRQVLDPTNEDPDITLHKFTEGMASYLKNSDKWNSDVDEQLPANQHKEPVATEAELESLAKREADLLLHRQISDLKLQLQKVTDDNVLLRTHLTAAQDENCSILQVLDKKTSELKLQADRMKRLEREMNDKTEIICGLEGRNAALCNKFSQLGNELSTIHKDRKKLLSENAHLKEEMKKSQQLVTSKDELVGKLRNEAAMTEIQWKNKEKILNDRIDSLNRSIDELNEKVEELEEEYSNLQRSKKEKIVIQAAVSYAEELAAEGNLEQDLTTGSIASCSIPFSEEHYENLLLRITSDDIATEMIEAGEMHHHLPTNRTCTERFDVATQCDVEDLPSGNQVSESIQCCPNCLNAMDGPEYVDDSMTISNVEQHSSEQLLIAKYFPQENLGMEDGWGVFWSWIYNQLLPRGLNKPLFCLFIAIIFGLATFLPIDDGCITNPSIFSSLENYFQHCGRLSHDRIPII